MKRCPSLEETAKRGTPGVLNPIKRVGRDIRPLRSNSKTWMDCSITADSAHANIPVSIYVIYEMGNCEPPLIVAAPGVAHIFFIATKWSVGFPLFWDISRLCNVRCIDVPNFFYEFKYVIFPPIGIIHGPPPGSTANKLELARGELIQSNRISMPILFWALCCFWLPQLIRNAKNCAPTEKNLDGRVFAGESGTKA